MYLDVMFSTGGSAALNNKHIHRIAGAQGEFTHMGHKTPLMDHRNTRALDWKGC